MPQDAIVITDTITEGRSCNIKYSMDIYKEFQNKILVKWKILVEELYPLYIIDDWISNDLVTTDAWEEVQLESRQVQVRNLLKFIVRKMDGRRKYDLFIKILESKYQHVAEKLKLPNEEPAVNGNVSDEQQNAQKTTLDNYQRRILDVIIPNDHIDIFIQKLVFNLDDYEEIAVDWNIRKGTVERLFRKIKGRLPKGSFECFLLSLRLQQEDDQRLGDLANLLIRSVRQDMSIVNRLDDDTCRHRISVTGTTATIYPKTTDTVERGVLIISSDESIINELYEAARSREGSHYITKITNMTISGVERSSVVIYLESEVGNIKYKFVNNILNGSMEDIIRNLFNDEKVQQRLVPGIYNVKVKFESESKGQQTLSGMERINIIKANQRLLEDEFDPIELIDACSKGDIQKFGDMKNISDERRNILTERFKSMKLGESPNRRKRVKQFLDKIDDCSTEEFLTLMKAFGHKYLLTKLEEFRSISRSDKPGIYEISQECKKDKVFFDGEFKITVKKGTPDVILPKTSYLVTSERFVTLESIVTSELYTVNHVYWIKANVSEEIKIESKTDLSKYSGSTPYNPSLTIYNPSKYDDGEYTCFATNKAGTGKSATTTLCVAGPPSVTAKQERYSVTADSFVTLTCEITSRLPVTRVYWEKNCSGKKSELSFTGSSITFSSVGLADAGDYICYATNRAGTGRSRQIRLDVSGEPPSITVENQSYSVTAGSSVTLTCSVYSTSRITDVYWEKSTNGWRTKIDTVRSKYRDGSIYKPSLTIFNAEASDSGEYTCFASNNMGTGNSRPVNITVTDSSVKFDELADDSEQWRHIREITIPNLKKIEDRLDVAGEKIRAFRYGRNTLVGLGFLGAVLAPITAGTSLGWTAAAFSVGAGTVTLGTLVIETMVEGGALEEAQRRIDEDRHQTQHLRQRVSFYMNRGGTEKERQFAEQLRTEFPDAIINVVNTSFKEFVTSFIKTDVGSVFKAKENVTKLRITLTEELKRVERLEKEYRDRRLGRVY